MNILISIVRTLIILVLAYLLNRQGYERGFSDRQEIYLDVIENLINQCDQKKDGDE